MGFLSSSHSHSAAAAAASPVSRKIQIAPFFPFFCTCHFLHEQQLVFSSEPNSCVTQVAQNISGRRANLALPTSYFIPDY